MPTRPLRVLVSALVLALTATACDGVGKRAFQPNISFPFAVFPISNAPVNVPTAINFLNGPTFANTSFAFDLEQAAQILEDAGWVMDGDVRAKDGVELKIAYSTSINPVRQKTQQVNKQAFEQIGIQTSLLQVDSGIFFDSSAGNDRNISHFYFDISMYTNNPPSPIPTSFFLSWVAGENNSNVAQESNGWSGQNYQRYVNEEFDALYNELLTQTDVEGAYQQLIALNDILINDVVIIPQVNRPADTYAISKRLRNENVALGAGYEQNYWNIANWNTVAE